jgi:hypothetical protein
MKPLLAIGLAGLLAGCATQYEWDLDHKTGQVYLAGTRRVFNPGAAQQIAEGAANDLGSFAQGYAQGAAEYQATHPTIYVTPTYVPPQQHGTATVFTPGQPMTFINY